MNRINEWWANLLGMPPLASSNGQDVDNLIIYVHWLMLALFVGWIIYFVYAVWRFHKKRNPKADYHGVRNHASNYIELTVAGIEAVLLIFVAVPLWSKAVDKFPAPGESTVIQLVAQQYSWNFRYPGSDGVFGRQDCGSSARPMFLAWTPPTPTARTMLSCSTKSTFPSTNRSSSTSVPRT